MLGGKYVPFWVGHEAENLSGGITEACDSALRSVWIGVSVIHIGRYASGVGIPQNHLTSLFQPLKNPFLPGDEPSLSMGHGQVHTVDGGKKWAFARARPQMNPPVFKAAIGIAGKADEWAFVIWKQKESGAYENLKSVADT